ncbi:NAD(P)/FAD-dependent oxidoreductase [Paracoccus aerodenitrificans]|uniref:NAD(P)/FAD-dependent oxidoreductase n=1 Tax=Paracoccus aerodenitrificans TaxID=3017781 RepID=UPI0022F005AC|nr:FAD-dependent oxidoreductase [Paracoccus aerodenitrificans]WBU63688.1 FAD-dependent oxidoreductase [Paracoccus aerodenitrificans]
MASITVIGAGIAGLSVAWEIIRRGYQVTVIEAKQVGAGSSGGTVGALAPHAPDSWNLKKQVQFDSLMAAGQFWDEVAQTGGGDPGYARTGRIQPVSVSDLDRMQARIDGAAVNWQGKARIWLTRTPEAALIPESPDGWWLMDDLTARVNPYRACHALAAAIRAKGGEIVTGRSVTVADAGQRTIWATGAPGLTVLGDDLGRKQGQGVKGQSALVDFAAPETPQIYVDGLYIVPHADGTTGLGSTSENSFAHAQVDSGLDEVIARAFKLCPALAGTEILKRWAGIRPRARSRAPLMGVWPGRPGQFVLNGGFRIGFGMAPEMARMIADLVLEVRDAIPDLFRLQGRGETPITAG